MNGRGFVSSGSLPNGRYFEKEVLGITDESRQGRSIFWDKPKKLILEESLSEVIASNWALYAESVTTGDESFHNPTKPVMGKTRNLWASVKNWLPKKVEGEPVPLNLYISTGMNSLDFCHGVDLFFWWYGVYASVDLSVRDKKSGEIQADFLFGPEELENRKMLDFGKKVASCLISRVHFYKERSSCPSLELMLTDVLQSELAK